MSNYYNRGRSNMSPRKLALLIGGGALFLIAIIMFFMSWVDVSPGHEGAIYRPYTGGVDRERVYKEGTYFIAPWNDMVTYDVRQKSNKYVQSIMDKNGTDIEVSVSINYSIKKGEVANIYLEVQNFEDIVDDKSLGAIKDVVGRYTYREVYSSKRESLEKEIENILSKDLDENFMKLHYVEISDVDLPSNISNQITEKETQKERNKTAELKEQEEEFLANAKIEKARGDSALVISARYKADAIRLESEQIAKNPEYIELIKWQGYADGKGSPFGSNNVYGDGAVSILKSANKPNQKSKILT